MPRARRARTQKWFRVEVFGFENVPAEGGALIVSNHSGAVPLDAMISALVTYDHTDRFLRRLACGGSVAAGFVSAAVRTGVPIVPCSEVGAEEVRETIQQMLHALLIRRRSVFA